MTMTQPVELNTLEVRWFGDGDPPAQLLDWLNTQGSVERTHRRDLYFAGGTAGRNLKLRGGDSPRIELKWRLDTTVRSFTAAVTGMIEQWYKWSFALAESTTLWDDNTTGLWLPVEKTRRLYTRSVPVNDITATAQFEVTELQVNGKSAWTCGLEVDGPPSTLVEAFQRVETTLLDEAFPLSLSATASMGYVAWLGETFDIRPHSAVTVGLSEF